jgi:putative Holliday junction resolvase
MAGMSEQSTKFQTVLALDVGHRRIGVARAHLEAPFPQPLCTLEDPDSFLQNIIGLCKSEHAAAVVIGLPRGLSGQDTAQTEAVRAFGDTLASQLEDQLHIAVYWMDEALTSAKAEEELRKRGKQYAKGDVDALAATFILDDFVSQHKGKIQELYHG